ncbi:TetR/AcrR family transcriptional regulator [Kineothrix sp. MB12-C1]|uniref:TetR/AcrR family transcriptional regulator n=1 Tax=Kineothrix sp. MB12-C1 TaxID=3070215 RepID=UPI0027D2FC62|nr:TetR/AcrR family transcriptional regulator [Kineothrix sp. MB12-C1]WMC93451.1 TetR/AcrR family transcriptional regulator [Kineothrix sp. MB12-C1]
MADESTQKRILEAGKTEFMKKGYENASLRTIAREASVTTGAIYGYYPDKAALFSALVSEPANYLRDWYFSVQSEFDAFPAEHKEKQMHGYTSNALEKFIDYVYLHFDAFKLVVCHSAGTEYEHYIDSLLAIETEHTRRFIDTLRGLGHDIPFIDDDMSHILSSAFYYGIFETVAHDMPKERALEYIRTLNKFYSAGWDTILGLKKS